MQDINLKVEVQLIEINLKFYLQIRLKNDRKTVFK